MAPPRSLKEQFYPECRFGGFSHVDGTVAFYTRIRALLDPTSVVLDVGCGRGAAKDRLVQKPSERLRVLQESCHTTIGIDVDPAGADNPFMDEFHLIDSDRWPVDDASIDLLYADYVLEHLEHPDQFFAECSRVTKPGGYI